MKDQIKSDINALIDSDPPRTALPAIEPVGGYPAQRGRSTYAAPQAAGGSGGGIASPLTETGREYFEQEAVMSLEGVVAVTVRRTKTLYMEDADSQAVELRFSE